MAAAAPATAVAAAQSIQTAFYTSDYLQKDTNIINTLNQKYILKSNSKSHFCLRVGRGAGEQKWDRKEGRHCREFEIDIILI